MSDGHKAQPLSAARFPDQAAQIRLFRELGQLQRELPVHARGTNAWRRAEARKTRIMAQISALMAYRRYSG